MANDLVGQTLGRYRIHARLGQGGMGVVFRATDEKLRREVALKVLSDGVVDDADRRARFLREARLAAALTHPNIATVHDVGETDDGHIYIAMELVAGASLRKRLDAGPLGAAAVLAVGKDLSRALIKAHKIGIVHRDLKPENIMVSEELEVKVLDFGLAKPVDAGSGAPETSSVVTEDGRVVGTPGYMSPEQAAGRDIDARTDIFAVGVVLYEMVSGVRPFRGESAIDVIIATARDEPERLAAIAPDVGPQLERVILRCLEKNADARYADAPELMSALEALGDAAAGAPRSDAPARGKPAPARNVGALPTQPSLLGAALPRSERRGRSWVLVTVTATAAAVALLVVGARQLRGLTPPPPPEIAAPKPVATSLSDLPPLVSQDPHAVAEYVAGMQALRDDDWGLAEHHFLRVVELEPFLALAHLRLAMVAEGTLDESLRREHYTKAVSLRSQLSKRDEGMMVALEPVLQRLREDRAEAVKRLERLAAQYPADTEIQVWLAMMQESNASGLAAADRAVALDPRDGQAWQSRGNILAALGRAADSRLSFERCGTVSPGSAECFLGLIWLDSMEGRCADAERDARRAVDRDPALATNLACVMFGAGRPIGAVREVLDQAAAGDRAKMPTMLDQTRLALGAGDFTAARALAEKAEALANSDVHTPFRDHLLPAIMLAGIARETGDDVQAFPVAWGFVSRSDAWSKSTQGDGGIDASLGLARQAVGVGGLSRDQFVARREAWIEDERRNLAQTGLIWTYAFAATSETPEEAREALAELPRFAPLSSYAYYVGIPDAEIGRTYLLAGQLDDAVRHLTKAAGSCSAFRHPFVHTRALLDLGKALEASGDAPGACGAYRRVIDRWGNAKPRSISAEHARARSKVLACAK